MTYTPTVWQAGDVITAEKLNKIENGITNNGVKTFEMVDSVVKAAPEEMQVGAIIIWEDDVANNSGAEIVIYKGIVRKSSDNYATDIYIIETIGRDGATIEYNYDAVAGGYIIDDDPPK